MYSELLVHAVMIKQSLSYTFSWGILINTCRELLLNTAQTVKIRHSFALKKLSLWLALNSTAIAFKRNTSVDSCKGKGFKEEFSVYARIMSGFKSMIYFIALSIERHVRANWKLLLVLWCQRNSILFDALDIYALEMAIHRCLEGLMSWLELQVEILMTFATWRNLLLLPSSLASYLWSETANAIARLKGKTWWGPR